MHPDTEAVIEHFGFSRLPVEGTLYRSTYRSLFLLADGGNAGTAMIGLYADDPASVSCFHRLSFDEVWHVYGGDPFVLVLLYPDGTSGEILMGCDPLAGQNVQFVVPARVWQAGYMLPGGRYSLFGCTMAPGFTASCFEAGIASELVRLYPDRASDIARLGVNGEMRHMPEDLGG